MNNCGNHIKCECSCHTEGGFHITPCCFTCEFCKQERVKDPSTKKQKHLTHKQAGKTIRSLKMNQIEDTKFFLKLKKNLEDSIKRIGKLKCPESQNLKECAAYGRLNKILQSNIENLVNLKLIYESKYQMKLDEVKIIKIKNELEGWTEEKVFCNSRKFAI